MVHKMYQSVNWQGDARINNAIFRSIDFSTGYDLNH